MHANLHVPFLQRLWWRLQWCEVVCGEDIEEGQRWVVFNWFYSFEWILTIVVLFICSPIDNSVHNFTVFQAVCIAISCVPHSVYCRHTQLLYCVSEFLPISTSLGQRCIFIANSFGTLSPPAIAFHWTTAKGVHYTQCLCVSIVLQCTWVVTGTPSLSLAAKEVFKGVLANVMTQECQLIVLHLWKGE